MLLFTFTCSKYQTYLYDEKTPAFDFCMAYFVKNSQIVL